MKSFEEYLTQNAQTHNFSCKGGMVIFTNSRSKKFIFDEHDIVKSLELIWSSNHKLDDLLAGNWLYEEDKYRAAFDKIFEGVKNNSVATQYGSQTPNTVRALELYASYLTGDVPTKELKMPESLKHDNLARIFLNTESLFRKWLLEKEKLSPKSVENYTIALKGIISRDGGFNVFEIIRNEDAEEKLLPILENDLIKERNSNGNGMYKSAILKYILFLRDGIFSPIMNDDIEISPDRIVGEFSNAIKNHYIIKMYPENESESLN
jgi:hypothetical protein